MSLTGLLVWGLVTLIAAGVGFGDRTLSLKRIGRVAVFGVGFVGLGALGRLMLWPQAPGVLYFSFEELFRGQILLAIGYSAILSVPIMFARLLLSRTTINK